MGSSLPDFNSDLAKDMNREKEKLNRFLGTQQSSTQRHLEYSEKMRK